MLRTPGRTTNLSRVRLIECESEIVGEIALTNAVQYLLIDLGNYIVSRRLPAQKWFVVRPGVRSYVTDFSPHKVPPAIGQTGKPRKYFNFKYLQNVKFCIVNDQSYIK